MTVVPVIIRALGSAREKALGLLGSCSPKSPPAIHFLIVFFDEIVPRTVRDWLFRCRQWAKVIEGERWFWGDVALVVVATKVAVEWL